MKSEILFIRRGNIYLKTNSVPDDKSLLYKSKRSKSRNQKKLKLSFKIYISEQKVKNDILDFKVLSFFSPPYKFPINPLPQSPNLLQIKSLLLCPFQLPAHPFYCTEAELFSPYQFFLHFELY